MVCADIRQQALCKNNVLRNSLSHIAQQVAVRAQPKGAKLRCARWMRIDQFAKEINKL